MPVVSPSLVVISPHEGSGANLNAAHWLMDAT